MFLGSCCILYYNWCRKSSTYNNCAFDLYRLVNKINSSIGQDPDSKILIGVLDIYGFESFLTNRCLTGMPLHLICCLCSHTYRVTYISLGRLVLRFMYFFFPTWGLARISLLKATKLHSLSHEGSSSSTEKKRHKRSNSEATKHQLLPVQKTTSARQQRPTSKNTNSSKTT